MLSTFSEGLASTTPSGETTNRPVDKDGMRQHEFDQFRIAPFKIGKAELCRGCVLFAKELARRDAHFGNQLQQPFARRGRFQVFDDFPLFVRLPDYSECISGRSAGWIVIDR